jgi:hypothetical protein
MWKWISSRYRHVRKIGRLWWVAALGAWGLFWTIDEVVGKWGWPLDKATWDKYTLHLPFDWRIGLIGFLAIMVVLLIEGSYQELSKSESALKALSEAPPDLDAEVVELFAQEIEGTTRVRGGVEHINMDLFVHAKLTLRNPATAKVDYYKLVVTLHGVPNDAVWHTGGFANSWGLVRDVQKLGNGQVRISGQRVTELSDHLHRGVSEGWLHFVASWMETGRIQQNFVYRLEIVGNGWKKHVEVSGKDVRRATIFDRIPQPEAS